MLNCRESIAGDAAYCVSHLIRKGGEPFSHRLHYKMAQPLSDSGFEVDPVGNLGKYCVGVFFFCFDRLEESSVFIKA